MAVSMPIMGIFARGAGHGHILMASAGIGIGRMGVNAARETLAGDPDDNFWRMWARHHKRSRLRKAFTMKAMVEEVEMEEEEDVEVEMVEEEEEGES